MDETPDLPVLIPPELRKNLLTIMDGIVHHPVSYGQLKMIEMQLRSCPEQKPPESPPSDQEKT